jgi:hypothetical protein
MADPDPKPYLDYLDKEMAIMGLLSTFCVLVIGLTVNSSLSAERGELKNVWPYGHWYLLGGSFWTLIAALLFYRQRSLLAYYYGQIALCHVQGSAGEFENVESAMLDADAWITWFFYQCGFACLIAGFVNYGIALLSLTVPGVRDPTAIWSLALAGGVVVLAFAVWNYRRLRAVDEDPRERRRSGWIAKPSRTIRRRKGKAG